MPGREGWVRVKWEKGASAPLLCPSSLAFLSEEIDEKILSQDLG